MITLLNCCIMNKEGDIGEFFTTESPLREEQQSILFVRGADIAPILSAVIEEHEFYTVVKECLQPKVKKYARLALTVYVNHFIVSHWSKYSNYDLDKFSDHLSTLLNSYPGFIPNDTISGRASITSKGWIKSFATISGMAASMKEWVYRGRYSEVLMDLIIHDLINHYDVIALHFDSLQQVIVNSLHRNDWKWIESGTSEKIQKQEQDSFMHEKIQKGNLILTNAS